MAEVQPDTTRLERPSVKVTKYLLTSTLTSKGWPKAVGEVQRS